MAKSKKNISCCESFCFSYMCYLSEGDLFIDPPCLIAGDVREPFLRIDCPSVPPGPTGSMPLLLACWHQSLSQWVPHTRENKQALLQVSVNHSLVTITRNATFLNSLQLSWTTLCLPTSFFLRKWSVDLTIDCYADVGFSSHSKFGVACANPGPWFITLHDEASPAL